MFRGLKKNELTLVRRGLDYWGAFDLSKDLNLIAKQDQGEKVEIFATTPEVKFFAIGREPEPMTAGLCIGEAGKKQFFPTLEGLYMIARVSDKKKVKVTGQAEALVLYGRDVFGSSISWAEESIAQNERVIIANKFGEAIGVGRARTNYKEIFADKVTVTNEADVGLYIRNQDLMAGSTCRIGF